MLAQCRRSGCAVRSFGICLLEFHGVWHSGSRPIGARCPSLSLSSLRNHCRDAVSSSFIGVQQFCGSFSGQKRAISGFEAGTDARQVTDSVQVDRNARPHRRRSGLGESLLIPNSGETDDIET